MKFICLTLLIVSGITDSRSAEEYTVLGPEDPVFAVPGEDVILPCSVKPNISVVDMRVEWFRLDLKDSVHLYEDHEDRNTEQIQSYRGRTKLNHLELQTGNASLKLSTVQISDEGRYKCFIQSKSWSDDVTVDVRVEVEGRLPVITVDGFDGSGGLHLQCESEGWYPEPDLEWLDSEGVRLSSETAETHRNTDGFSVKHTIVVYHSGKIHCRVKLKHHMLETLIDTTNNRFISWRTSVILMSVFVVLVGIAGILITVFALRNRAHDQLQKEHRKIQNAHKQLQDEKSRIQNAHAQLQKEHRSIQNEKSRIQNEFSLERDQLLQSEKIIFPKALPHLRTHTAVKVTLDADSAHPRLIVSPDGKQVRYGGGRGWKEGNDRFYYYLGVLGKDGFSSWSFYFEVQVTDQTEWDLGVARASVNRKSKNMRPDEGYWTVSRLYNNRGDERYSARESPPVSLSLRVKPERIGVFVDYDESFVSFYDVKSMSHIYSYTHQSFNEEKLYPFVGLGYSSNENPTPLIICDDY